MPPSAIRFFTDPAALSDCDIVLVTVKSGSTAEAAASLAPVLKPGTHVISLQNGIHNAAILRQGLPACTVLAGMVPFNVIGRGEGRFHQGTEGRLEIARDPALQPLVAAFAAAGFPVILHDDMMPVLWGKLLLNLNNAINALANVPLVAQLAQRPFRRCLALAQDEALAVMARAGIVPATLAAVPPRWIPTILRLPDGLYKLIAGRALKMDPLARSSMSDDLAAGRMPEVDWINGEIVALAQAQGHKAPVNAMLCRLVKEAHAAPERPSWSAEALFTALREAC